MTAAAASARTRSMGGDASSLLKVLALACRRHKRLPTLQSLNLQWPLCAPKPKEGGNATVIVPHGLAFGTDASVTERNSLEQGKVRVLATTHHITMLQLTPQGRCNLCFAGLPHKVAD